MAAKNHGETTESGRDFLQQLKSLLGNFNIAPTSAPGLFSVATGLRAGENTRRTRPVLT